MRTEEQNFQAEHNTKYSFTAAAKLLPSCLTLCDPIDSSPPGSPVSGILQARTLEWVAISFSSASKWKVKVKSISRVQLFSTPWTAAYQAPLSMGFSRQAALLRSPLYLAFRQRLHSISSQRHKDVLREIWVGNQDPCILILFRPHHACCRASGVFLKI